MKYDDYKITESVSFPNQKYHKSKGCAQKEEGQRIGRLYRSGDNLRGHKLRSIDIANNRNGLLKA